MTSRAMFYSLYRFLIWPFLRFAFYFISLFHRKIRDGLEMRKNQPWLVGETQPAHASIWIHCASGEFEYAKPVITRLKKLRPELRIVVTYFSPTFAQVVQKFPGVDFATPLPWDTSSDLGAFITKQNLFCLLIARTDTWPEMLRQAKAHGLQTLLFAATLPAQAGRSRNLFARWMSRHVFSYLDAIYCVDHEDYVEFKKLVPATEVIVAGDTRYDQVMERLAHAKPIKESLFLGRSKNEIFVCGSTWAEDEAVLLAAAEKLSRSGERIGIVIVPHEPTTDHLDELENQLRKASLESCRYTQSELWPSGSVLLVDKIGLLAELYQKGSRAFVGGSFKKTVHSVMEPLAAGALTFVGPLYKNNREAVEFRDMGFVKVVPDAKTLVAFLRVTDGRERDSETSLAILRAVEARSGKSDLIIKWVTERVPTNSGSIPD